MEEFKLKLQNEGLVVGKIHIYRFIMDGNFYRYLFERKHVKPENVKQDIYNHLHHQYLNAHVYLAIKSLVGSEINPDRLGNLLQHIDVILTPGQGLLDNIDPVKFTHRTIAEFCLDNWVFNILIGDKPLNRKDLKVFSKLFNLRYVKTRDDNLLKTLLLENEKPIDFVFKFEEFNLNEIASQAMMLKNWEILCVLVGCLRKGSRTKFEIEMKRNEAPDKRVYLRPYNKNTSLPRAKDPCFISTKFIIEWMFLKNRPLDWIQQYPSGFYVEGVSVDTFVNTADDTAHKDSYKIPVASRLIYIPRESKYALNSETDSYIFEYLHMDGSRYQQQRIDNPCM